MNETAKDFLARCFAPGSTIALLLRTESPAKTQQRVVTLEQALAPRYLGWLAHENRHGANVYVAANPLRPGSRKRTKESIESVRHLYINIDTDGDARLAMLQASDAVPPASAILSTSPGKYQVFWRVEGFKFEQQEIALRRLAIAFGGDPACTDCNRVLRIPGFLNRKYAPAHHVTVEYPSDTIARPSDFYFPEDPIIAALLLRADARTNGSRKDSHSEADWAWACHELVQGRDPGKLTQELASRRADKPNPAYYAQITDSTANQIDQYASFIHASADDVIEEALKHCFLKDREFQEFLKSPDAQKTASTLRIRKPVVNDTAKRSARKPAPSASSPAQTPASAAGSKA